MDSEQILKMSILEADSELLAPKIKQNMSKNPVLNFHGKEKIVIIDDELCPVVSFYKKAQLSAKIKKEYRKYNIVVSDVFFTDTFKRVSENAYAFFLNKEYEHSYLIEDLKLKKCN